MLNFDVAPAILTPLVPAGTTLDLFQNRALISIVGFRFLNTRLVGVPIPFHRNFDEINLRFYVRRTLPSGEVRRGVTFIRELVPRLAIALTARFAYNEPYTACRMQSTVPASFTETPGRVSYSWRSAAAWHHISATTHGPPMIPPPHSKSAFITEHYWGYTPQRDGNTIEYQVTHPQWRVWNSHSFELSPNVSTFYGGPFATILATPPCSALIAVGSPIQVHAPRSFR